MTGLKTILKSIAVAFSIYSKIPMPRFEWGSKEMKYHLCFFPWVGALIGIALWIFTVLCSHFGTGKLFFLCGSLSIPLLITGGFHLDGFMDTMDAIHSYQEKERKLEILKDPHIGAFSVLCLCLYGLLFLGFYSEIKGRQMLLSVACSFFFSRCLSGISVLFFPSAKKDGMLHVFSSTAEKKMAGSLLFLQWMLCLVFLLFVNGWKGLYFVCAGLLCFLYYFKMSKRNFGGITGDLAGYFVSITELIFVMVAGIGSLIC